MTKLEQALSDPSNVFDTPDDVVQDNTLTRDEKIKILRQWEYDARDLAVAEEENMAGGNDNDSGLLDKVLRALHVLGATFNPDESPPTKHGG